MEVLLPLVALPVFRPWYYLFHSVALTTASFSVGVPPWNGFLLGLLLDGVAAWRIQRFRLRYTEGLPLELQPKWQGVARPIFFLVVPILVLPILHPILGAADVCSDELSNIFLSADAPVIATTMERYQRLEKLAQGCGLAAHFALNIAFVVAALCWSACSAEWLVKAAAVYPEISLRRKLVGIIGCAVFSLIAANVLWCGLGPEATTRRWDVVEKPGSSTVYHSLSAIMFMTMWAWFHFIAAVTARRK